LLFVSYRFWFGRRNRRHLSGNDNQGLEKERQLSGLSWIAFAFTMPHGEFERSGKMTNEHMPNMYNNGKLIRSNKYNTKNY